VRKYRDLKKSSRELVIEQKFGKRALQEQLKKEREDWEMLQSPKRLARK